MGDAQHPFLASTHTCMHPYIHTQRLTHNHSSGSERNFSERWSQGVVETKAMCAAVRLAAEVWAP